MLDVIGLQAIASAISLAVGMIAARLLPEAELSRYLLAQTVLTTGQLLASLGTRQTLERSFGLWRRKSSDHADALVSAFGALRLGATAAAGLVAVGLALSFEPRLFPRGLVGLVVAAVLARSMGDLPYHLLLAEGDRLAACAPLAFRQLARLPVLLAGYHWGGLAGIFAGVVIVDGAIAAHGWFRARALVRWRWRGWAPPGSAPEWSFTAGAASYSVLVIALNQVGPWFAGWLRPQAGPLVDFTLAWQLALQYLQLHYVVQQAEVPGLARVWESGDAMRFSSAFRRLLAATALVAAAAVGTLAVFGKPLSVFLFGAGREGLAAPLTWTFAGAGAWSIASAYVHGLFATGRSRPGIEAHAIMLLAALALFPLAAWGPGLAAIPVAFFFAALSGWSAAAWRFRAVVSDPAPSNRLSPHRAIHSPRFPMPLRAD